MEEDFDIKIIVPRKERTRSMADLLCRDPWVVNHMFDKLVDYVRESSADDKEAISNLRKMDFTAYMLVKIYRFDAQAVMDVLRNEYRMHDEDIRAEFMPVLSGEEVERMLA